MFVVFAGASGIAIASGWAPFTRDDSATVTEGGQVSVLDSGAASVLANDFDFERDPMTAVLTEEPDDGEVELNDDGTFIYRHDGDDDNDDEFRYRAYDGTGYSRETRVRIRVEEAPNNPPFVTGTPPDQEVVAGMFFQLDMSPYFGDLDPDDTLEFSVSGLPREFDIDKDSGLLSGTPRDNDARDTPYTARVTVEDRAGAKASVEFLLTVLPDNRADLEVSASVAQNPVSVGEPHAWQINVKNLGPAALDDGELVVQWNTSGADLDLSAPQNCTLNRNGTADPDIRCDLSGLDVGATLQFQVQGTQAADGDNSMIAVALSDDPILGNNAVVIGAQVAAARSEGPAQLLNVGAADVDTADFNGDGHADIVVTAGETTVFMNTGNRSFSTPGVSLGSGSGGNAVVALDWNGDGNVDVAVAGQANRVARIYFGDGSGGFGDTLNISAGDPGTVLDAVGGDFARDGFADFAVTGTKDTLLYRSTGSKNPSTTDIPAGAGIAIAAGDFNNDSYLDLVVVESSNRRVRVLRNSGNGRTFNGTGFRRGSVAAATADDVNGDGNADLLLAIDGDDLEAPQSLVLVQRSDGSFPAGTPIGASPLAKMLAGDVDGDGKQDIVAVNDGGVHQVYLGQPGGGFALNAEQIVSDGMRRGILIDFNTDQSLDLILAGQASGHVEFHANNGIGRLGLGDRVAPVISLIGEASMTLPAGAEYVEAGATATDDIDGDLTSSIQMSGSVDTGVVGTYSVTYSASDRAGNKGSAVRTVKVGVNQGTGGSGGGLVSPWFLLLEALLVAWLVVRRRARIRHRFVEF